MSMELIRNIKVLTKIQLKQSKSIILIVSISLGLWGIMSNFPLVFYGTYDEAIFDSGASINTLLVFFCVFIVAPSVTVLTNKRISMFPGTSTSRFISRLASDHIIMGVIVASSFLMYCLEYLILSIIRVFKADLSIGLAFDIKYALVGVLMLLSYYFLVYAIAIFICTLATKLGRIKAIIFYGICFGIVILLVRYHVILMDEVFNCFTEESKLGLFLVKTWGAWLISLIASFMIARSSKIMKEEMPGAKYLMISIMYFVVMAVAFASSYRDYSDDSHTREYTYSSLEYFEYLKETKLNSETFIKCEEFDFETMDTDIGVNNYYYSQSEAVAEGILDKDFVFEKNKIRVTTFLPGNKYNGTYLYENYLKNMTISCLNSKLHYSFPKTHTTIINTMWGDASKFLNNYKIDEEGALDFHEFPDVITYVIVPDHILVNNSVE